MAKKYRVIRVPEDVYFRFVKIQNLMEEDVNKFNRLMGKKKKIPVTLATALRAVAFEEFRHPIFVKLKKVGNYVNKKEKKE